MPSLVGIVAPHDTYFIQSEIAKTTNFTKIRNTTTNNKGNAISKPKNHLN
jgi:hypothetical protein